MKILQFTAAFAILILLYGFGCSSGSSSGDSTIKSSGPLTGLGGSMARFTIKDNHLYTLSANKIKVYDISSPQQMNNINEVEVGWNIETIFPYKENLFIGSQNGMYIYDITSPASPGFVSQYWHIRSCDPVVVNDKYAYVTLRGDNDVCGWSGNRLEIVDISNLTNPSYVTEFQMNNPYGLGLSGDSVLFVCDGDDGLKIMGNIHDPWQINQIGYLAGLNTYDIIPLNNIAVITGNDGLYQYDYTNINDMKLLSKIPITN